MSLSPDSHWLALGSLEGRVTLLHLQSNCNSVSVVHRFEWRAHEGKVFSLTWLGSFGGCPSSLLTCGPSGEMVGTQHTHTHTHTHTAFSVVVQVIWEVPGATTPPPPPLAHLRLPLSRHRWVTAAVLLPQLTETDHTDTTFSVEQNPTSTSSHWLVCGDRKGSLHLFQTSPSRKVLHLYH